MSEIIKLYENAGIKPYIYCSKPRLDCNARETGNCKKDCEYYSGEKLFTPFTAEKQLELIKWLAKQPLTIDNVDGEFEFSTGYKLSDFGNFEESLAKLINNLWQDLTETEQEEIRKILKG